MSRRETVPVIVVGERLQNVAPSGEAIVAARARQTRQFIPQGREALELGLDLGELGGGQGMGVAAIAFGTRNQVEQLANGFKAKAELTGMPYEGHPLPMRAPIEPVPPPSVRSGLGNSPTSSYQRTVCTLQPASRASCPMGISAPVRAAVRRMVGASMKPRWGRAKRAANWTG